MTTSLTTLNVMPKLKDKAEHFYNTWSQLFIVMLIAIMLNVIKLSVVTLIVLAPNYEKQNIENDFGIPYEQCLVDSHKSAGVNIFGEKVQSVEPTY
jgi:hypothetical protein